MNRMQEKLLALKARLEDRKGQNTVEYLLMMTVVVGVVMGVGYVMRDKIKDIFGQVAGVISKAVSSMGG